MANLLETLNMLLGRRKKPPQKKIKKTYVFLWEGTDRKKNSIKGSIQSINLELAKAELRKQGVKITRIKKESTKFFSRPSGKIKPLDIALFTRQLYTMVRAGIPLIQAFAVVSDGVQNLALRALILNIKREVEGGNSFEIALRKHPEYFDNLYCSLVGSGEQSGSLEIMLDRLATYREKSEHIKAKVKKAIKYPIAVIMIALIVTIILLVKVVPTFQTLFQGFGAELPAFTRLVIGLSDGLQHYWLVLIAVLAGAVVSFQQAKKNSKEFSNFLDQLVLNIPLIGDIIYKSTIARFARTLSTTFAAGVPLVDALNSLTGTTNNIIYIRAIKKIRDDVSAGQQLQIAMRNSNIFPPLAIQMVTVGEESGTLDNMLDKLAMHFEEEVENSVDGLTSLMEPIIMSVLGVLIGGLIIAMYLPIFKLGSVI